MAHSFLYNVRNAHLTDCVWKNTPCKESFEYLPSDHNVLKHELIENLKTWTQTDANSFYIVPKIDSTAKRTMMQSIKSLEADWKSDEFSSCCDLLLLAGSGWCLASAYDQSHFVQCKYCNKCISVQCYEYKKTLCLLPENFCDAHSNNSFLQRLNEEKEAEDEEKEKEKEQKQNVVGNDTESVMFKLSKLGLRIEPNIRRSHNFQIYETVFLQQPAHFNSAPLSSNSSPTFKPFGHNVQSNVVQSMRWPKLSIFNRSNSLSLSPSTTRKNKRSHDQMSKGAPEESMNGSSRKKLKTVSLNQQKQKLRKNRKRKVMESDFEESEVVSSKKRKLSSVSSICSSSSPSPNKKKNKSRKRKFGEVFLTDDIKPADNEIVFDRDRPSKRMRMGTPIIRRKKVFDPINLHNDYCPFRKQHTYNRQLVYGWMYCLKLLPKDVMYLTQLMAEESKANGGC